MQTKTRERLAGVDAGFAGVKSPFCWGCAEVLPGLAERG